MTPVRHPWLLTAPWYEWLRQDFPDRDPRAMRPAIQKFAGTDFVTRFLADPQDSLKYSDTLPDADDLWSYSRPRASVARGADNRLLRLSTREIVHTPLRKLYLDTHNRFYLVVVEARCARPGLPSPVEEELDGVEAFLVVRRRTVDVPPPLRTPELARLVRRVSAARAAAQRDDRDGGVELAAAITSLEEWSARNGVRPGVQRWRVLEAGRVGGWEDAFDETPDEPGGLDGELTVPMWRVPAPVDAPGHAAAGRVLFFGVVPTMSGDVDPDGRPRLDDEHRYEIRCALARPPQPGHEHCPPRLTWSAPTEPYALAAFFDPVGTANQTVNVRLPDFASLEAFAGRPGRGGGRGGVRFSTPDNSHIRITGKLPDVSGRTDGPAEVCTFALPLITIVAFFVFSLFLPIVVFALQLWWMLTLRICFPPSADMAGAFDALVKINGPELRADLAADAAVAVVFGTEKPARESDLREAFNQVQGEDMAERLLAPFPRDPEQPTGPKDERDPTVLAKVLVGWVEPPGADEPDPADEVPQDRVERDEVVLR